MLRALTFAAVMITAVEAAERLAWDYSGDLSQVVRFGVSFEKTNTTGIVTYTTNTFIYIDFLPSGHWTALVTTHGTNGVTRTSEPFLLPVPERVANIRLQKATSPNGPWTNVAGYYEPVVSNAFFRLEPDVSR